MYTGDMEDVGSCMQLLATCYDLKAISVQDLTNTKIIVKTASNVQSFNQLVDFLENELYPVLPYEVDVGVES